MSQPNHIKKESDINTWGFFTYFKNLLGYHFYAFNILNILVGLLDGLGLAMFIPLLGLATGTNTGENSLGNLSFVTDIFENLGIPLNLISVLAIMLVIFTLKGIITYAKNLYFIKLRLWSVRKLRYQLIDLLRALSYRGFTESDPGRIQFAMIGEIRRLVQSLTSFIKTIESLVIMFSYVVLAFFANWKFAFLVAIGGILSNFVYKIINNLTRKEAKKISNIGNKFNGYLIQAIHNFKYLKATNSFTQYEKNLKNSIYDFEQTQFRIGVLNNIGISIREPITILIIASVLIFYIYGIGGTFGGILVSLLLFYRALNSLINMQTYWNNFIGDSAALDAINELSENLESKGEVKQLPHQDFTISSIEIKKANLFFGETQVLNDINLHLNNKKTIAFVGESGAGKSTLANVIGGLIDINQGEILVNDKPLNPNQLENYRNQIGYIAQEPVIFNDTIYNNITFWAPKTEKNLQKFNECLRLVHLQNMVESLDLKEDAPLGNNGILVSGGQKQRISIARELFREVDLLIMDEATSALDTETENIIKENIATLHGKYMMVIIAHRLSTIKHADEIYLMRDGKIVNNGNYQELYQKSEQFKKMVDLQEI